MKLKSLILAVGMLTVGSAMAAGDTPYGIEDGKLDEKTWLGMKIYQRGRCETCHGPDATGSAAFPNLVEALKSKIDEAKFKDIVLNGQGTMPAMKDAVMGIKMLKKKGTSEADALDSLFA